MKRSMQVKSKVPTKPPVVERSPGEIAVSVSRELKLASDQTAALVQTLGTILAFKGEIEGLEEALGPYSQFVKHFKRIERQLRRLRLELSQNEKLVDHFLSGSLSRSFDRLVNCPPLRFGEGETGRFCLEIIDALHGPFSASTGSTSRRFLILAPRRSASTTR